MTPWYGRTGFSSESVMGHLMASAYPISALLLIIIAIIIIAIIGGASAGVRMAVVLNWALKF